MKNVGINKSKTAFAAVLVVAGVLYALISLVNHYLFKTYALDLGLYTHAMYEYAHFRAADCGMFNEATQNLLSDHFDLYLPLMSPLIYVFGSYTLLLVQIAAVLLGGWGIYKLIKLYTDDDWMPVLAAATFFFSFGIIHALSYDYHSNVLTAMMLPWLLYFLKKQRFALSSLFVVLFVIGKENMSLWLFFIVLALMWDYRKDRKTLWHLAAYAVFSVAYFLIVNMIVMPKLGGNGGGFARYAHLGNNYVDIAQRLVSHPLEALGLLFANTLGLPKFDGVKEEFYLCALTTGMLLMLLKPNYLLMLVPLIGQKMLAVDPTFWGVSFQYSVEFMPVIVIASFLVIIKLKKQVWRVILASCLLLSTVLTTFYTIGVPKSAVVLDKLCVYQGRHYVQKEFDSHFARQLLGMIPEEASVSAASMFVPHLACRDHVENFGYVKDTKAEFILITEHYFLFQRNHELMFGNRDEYETVATDGNLYLLRRKQP